MHKKTLTILFVLCCCLYGLTQESINSYKYIIVPSEFDFLEEKDKYRLNTLTRYLFKQNGFTVYFDEQELPKDLLNDKCKGLNVDVDKAKSGLFKTKLEIVLKNCYGEEVFRSRTGSTREKDYKKAYTEALKDAFVSIEELNYTYVPYEETKTNEVNENESVKEMVQVIDTEDNTDDEIINSEGNDTKKVEASLTNTNENSSEMYYANAITHGYELINKNSNTIMVLIKTSAEDVFMVKHKNAIVYKDENYWIYYENSNDEIITYTIKIKFKK